MNRYSAESRTFTKKPLWYWQFDLQRRARLEGNHPFVSFNFAKQMLKQFA